MKGLRKKRTVIAINANSKGSFGKNRDTMDDAKEPREVIERTENVRGRRFCTTRSGDKKASEEANAKYNEMLYYGFGVSDEDQGELIS